MLLSHLNISRAINLKLINWKFSMTAYMSAEHDPSRELLCAASIVHALGPVIFNRKPSSIQMSITILLY